MTLRALRVVSSAIYTGQGPMLRGSFDSESQATDRELLD